MSLTEIIDKALLEEQAARASRERSGKYNPSSLGRCYRMQYWNRQNVPQSNPVDVRTLRIFRVGSLFHDFVQGFIPDAQCEVEISTPDLYGFADVVTTDTVWDIKSQHSRAFWYMEKAGYDIAKERYTNILQVVCYGIILGKEKAKLLFISKDDLCTAEYEFKVSEWAHEVTKEVDALRNFWSGKTLPPPKPRAYGVDKKNSQPNECYKYCPFRDKCFALEGVPIPATKGE